jgi:hypothetical protein
MDKEVYMRTTVPVALRADRKYVQAVRAVAMRRGMDAAGLIRESIDRAYGEEIQGQLIFFAENGQHFDHRSNRDTNTETA